MAKTLPTYPRIVYTLTLNYSIRKVTLTRPYSETSTWGGYTARGVFYSERDIYPSQAAAIKAGRAQLKRRKKNIEGALAMIEKQSAALDKAEAASTENGQRGSGG